MTKFREWELIPIDRAKGQLFGYDIYPSEYKKISNDIGLVKISENQFDKSSDESYRLAPLIRKGAQIDDALISKLKIKKCTVVPVLFPDGPKQLKKLTSFASKHTVLLAGRVYSCVKDWLDATRKDRTVSVVLAVKKYKTPLLQSLNKALKDWDNVVTTLINDVLVSDENLSVLSLFDDYIYEKGKSDEQKNHGIEVTLLALMLARKCGMGVDELKNIGIAGLLHDIGLIYYEEQIREQMDFSDQILDPYQIKEMYDMHSMFGAVMVTKKNGETISGLNNDVRNIILEHEQKINGSGPSVYNRDFKEELKLLGINKKTVYVGQNSLIMNNKAPSELYYPHKDLIKKTMSMSSQILNISETYVSYLNNYIRKKVDYPHQNTVKRMINEAGTKINGLMFERFFNYLIPPDCYPEKLIVTIQFLNPSTEKEKLKYHNYKGVIYTKPEKDRPNRKVLHPIKNATGEDVKSNVVFDLNKDKKNLYLKLDNWKH